MCVHMHCSCTMSDLELVSFIVEENKRRKRRKIIFTKLYFESVVLGLAYLSSQHGPRDVGCFNDMMSAGILLGSICSRKCMMALKLHAMMSYV